MGDPRNSNMYYLSSILELIKLWQAEAFCIPARPKSGVVDP